MSFAGKRSCSTWTWLGLYEVEIRLLNQALKRNIRRFPDDFMFQLTFEEAEASWSQIVTMKRGMNIRVPLKMA